MTVKCEFSGLFPFLSGSSDYNDRNGNDGIFFFLFEDISECRSGHAENGGIKGGEVQFVNIDFHLNGKNVSPRDQTVSAMRTRRICG